MKAASNEMALGLCRGLAFPVTAVGTGWARMVFGQLGREEATQRWSWMEGQTLETTQQQCPAPAGL